MEEKRCNRRGCRPQSQMGDGPVLPDLMSQLPEDAAPAPADSRTAVPLPEPPLPADCTLASDPLNSIFAAQVPMAMAYVPMQVICKVYDPEVGLSRGTIFPCLDKPFLGEEALPRE